MQNVSTMEILTIEEFAERLRISRSTAYQWVVAGWLVTGRHVLHIGRVVRILWNADLIDYLLSLSDAGLEKQERPRLIRNGKGGRNSVAFDLDYLESGD